MPAFREVLEQWARVELDDALYAPTDDILGLETLVEVTPFDGINPRDGNDTPALVSARSRSDGESSCRLSAAAAART